MGLLATLHLLDQQIALEKDFARDATKDPVLMERLLSDPAGPRDRSIQTLLAQSLHPVSPPPSNP